MSPGWVFACYLLAAIFFFIRFLLGAMAAPPEPSPTYTAVSRVDWVALGLLFALLPTLVAAATHLH
jgi:hypothetical protein